MPLANIMLEEDEVDELTEHLVVNMLGDAGFLYDVAQHYAEQFTRREYEEWMNKETSDASDST